MATGGLAPDHKTIAEFRKNNKKAVEMAHKEFIRICNELKLIGKEVVAVDGTKIRANNSRKNNVTISKLNKMIEHHNESIHEYLKQLAENDVAEHFLDFEYFLKKNNSEIKWKAIEQLLRRMKYLMEIGSINKDAWSDSWENIYNIYINNKDEEFVPELIWTGFLFVDGDENMIRAEITRQINDIPYREGVKDAFDLERLNGVKYMYCKRGKWDLRQMIELKSTL